MTRLAPWLLMPLALMLLVSGSLAEDDYFYDEEAETEEVASLHVPVFSSRPQQFDVMAGEDVTLPCLMDKLTSVIIWKSSSETGDKVYYTGPISNTQDPRFKLETTGTKGNSLVISDVQADDSGTYICEVPSSPPVSLQHTINVKYVPTVKATPDNGVVVVSQKSAATLKCEAEGNPKPTVTWTRKGGLLPDGNKKMEGTELTISSVDRTHMGTYACTVDNGIGDAIVKDFRLEVNFAPEIEVTKKVHTGAGHEAQMVCNVHGQPMPKVTWGRVGGAALDKTHHRQEQDGAAYSLTIDEVQDVDLGRYTCRAHSDLGTAIAVIELTGQPKEVMMTSNPHGQEKDTYTLRWSVESYAPIEEYKVVYKNAQMNSSSPQQQWEEITVPAPPKDGSTVMYSHMHVLRNLARATAYEAAVTAKNKYGWSQEPAKPFKLYTYGAKVLGSTNPNSATSVRSGAMMAVAALGALLAVL